MLKDTIKNDMVKAMKEKNKVILTAIRTLNADIKYKELDLKKELEDIEVIGVIEKTIKQLKETLEFAVQANDETTINETKTVIEFFTGYMPKQLTDEEAKKVIEDTLKENSIESKADMGKAMQIVMAKLKGQYEGKKISGIVSQILK
ncbi:GatB/YqeY domain-containing protein [Clostridium cellulovorans]|uniref:GatB/YqeY domain-containing protein n=1 Tax=Clostridium cellulovorans (strain ATCC 35296 / DSM 3052 / OCM 3 / 743B) TaxID=573061 RepID=D9SVL6_CLOC7|nr:GatB/YqeY domain-containing protein [Clostridium cellulovorans]ADL51140.1 hypothetical protein Clocel_1387 [Clostridium cellulovorans 743B]